MNSFIAPQYNRYKIWIVSFGKINTFIRIQSVWHWIVKFHNVFAQSSWVIRSEIGIEYEGHVWECNIGIVNVKINYSWWLIILLYSLKVHEFGRFSFKVPSWIIWNPFSSYFCRLMPDKAIRFFSVLVPGSFRRIGLTAVHLVKVKKTLISLTSWLRIRSNYCYESQRASELQELMSCSPRNIILVIKWCTSVKLWPIKIFIYNFFEALSFSNELIKICRFHKFTSLKHTHFFALKR